MKLRECASPFPSDHFRMNSQVFPSITAAAVEEITDSESDSDADTKKKRYRKEKVGFRDRKVP